MIDIAVDNIPRLRAGFYYLATPYSEFAYGLEAAYFAACEMSDALTAAGLRHYAPIVATHAVATCAGIDKLDHAFWMSCDQPFMERAAGLIVGKFAGWETSAGVTQERKYFEQADKPIYAIDPLDAFGHTDEGC